MKLVRKKELLLLSQQDCVRFAIFCAEQVKEDWENIPECVNAINIVERWLEGKATEDECKVAAHAAYAAADAAADAYAADAAANAAYAASAAADAAAYVASHAAYAYAASSAYAAYAAYAYYAADAASTAYAADGNPHFINAQWNYYNELLHFDDIAEKLLLGATI